MGNVKKCFQGKREKESKTEQNHKMLLNKRRERAAKQGEFSKCFKDTGIKSSKRKVT